MIKTLIIPSFLNDYRAKVEKNEEGEGGEGEGEGGGSKRKSVLSRRLFSKTFKDVDGERSYGGGERGSRYSSRASARSEPMGSRTSARSEPITNLAGGGAGGNVAGLVLKRGLSDLSNSMESVSPRGDSSQGSDRFVGVFICVHWLIYIQCFHFENVLFSKTTHQNNLKIQ